MSHLPGNGGSGVRRPARTARPLKHAPWALLATLAAATPLHAAPPEKPLAPARAAYPHAAVRRAEYGKGGRSYWLFEPAEPTPATAAVVVFNHGWLATNPAAYGAWIDHLARSGSVVIFPRYQADALTPPSEFLANALAATTDALDVLDSAAGHPRPDRSRFALIGHSAGGNLAAHLAAVASESNLPKPRAVIVLMPGEVQASREPTLDRIPADTLLIVAAAEDDRIVGDLRARQIFIEAASIPASRKKYLLYRTDLHGSPFLIADHFAPTAFHPPFDTGDGLLPTVQKLRAEVNALDHAGFWPLADLTLSAAFLGQTLDDATDHGARFTHLGFWSDGRPVTPPLVGDDLALIPRVFPVNGLRLIPWTLDLPALLGGGERPGTKRR